MVAIQCQSHLDIQQNTWKKNKKIEKKEETEPDLLKAAVSF